MGRARKPGLGPRASDNYGPRYDLFSKRMWGTPPPYGIRGLPCAFCGEPIRPGNGEIDHRISPGIRPDLAQARLNVRPAHGSCRGCSDGRHGPRCRRSPSGLACNAVAAGNLAPKDTEGYPLAPWPEAFKRAAIDRATARNRAGASSVTRKRPESVPKRRETAGNGPNRPDLTPAARGVYPGAGRAWLGGRDDFRPLG